LENIFYTSAPTVSGGSLVLALQRFVLEPLNEQSKVVGRITSTMHCYYNQRYAQTLRSRQSLSRRFSDSSAM